MAREWTEFEVEAVVSDYFQMLLLELRGEDYSKKQHRKALMRLLDDRSDGSVEFKHQNISAVLLELGYPYIEGYKPRWNFQQLLADSVRARLEVDRELERAVRKSVDAVAVSQDADDIMGRLEDPPEPTAAARRRAESVAPGSRLVSPTINYLEREARNHSLGKMGEKFALEFERARLRCVGAERLSYQVEYVAETRGDGLGYDILSFEADGSERLIEVKTTGFGKQTPFFVSRNELRVSQAKSTYHLYRVFAYRSTPRIFVLRGALDRVCALEPTLYVAGVG